MTYYEALSDDDLGWLAAENLFGYVWVCDDDRPGRWLQQCVSVGRSLATGRERIVPAMMQAPWRKLDDNAARLVRNQIAELRLVREYLEAVHDVVIGREWDGTPQQELPPWDAIEWRLRQASPRQQCIAALKAKESSNG